MEHPALLLRRRAAPDYSPRTPFLEAVCLYTYGDLSRSEALSVFSRNDEGFDHFRSVVIAVELIELRQPEVVAGVVRIGQIVRITAQVTEELHQDERAVELGARQILILGNLSQRLRACCRIARICSASK